MPWCRVLADLRSDTLRQRLIQLDAVAQQHEQYHPYIPLPLLTDGHRFQYFFDTFHLPVDLCCADAHAAGVEDGIRAAVDDQPATPGLFGIIAMGPYTGEALEVGGPVAAAVRVVPEAQRHGREGTGADQFTLLVEDALALIVPYLHRHSQTRALQLAAPHRQRRAAEGETGDDIGAT